MCNAAAPAINRVKGSSPIKPPSEASTAARTPRAAPRRAKRQPPKCPAPPSLGQSQTLGTVLSEQAVAADGGAKTHSLPRGEYALLGTQGTLARVGIVSCRAHAYPVGPLRMGMAAAASSERERDSHGRTIRETLKLRHAAGSLHHQRAPRRGVVYVHDTALQSLAMFQEDARAHALRPHR